MTDMVSPIVDTTASEWACEALGLSPKSVEMSAGTLNRKRCHTGRCPEWWFRSLTTDRHELTGPPEVPVVFRTIRRWRRHRRPDRQTAVIAFRRDGSTAELCLVERNRGRDAEPGNAEARQPGLRSLVALLAGGAKLAAERTANTEPASRFQSAAAPSASSWKWLHVALRSAVPFHKPLVSSLRNAARSPRRA